MAVTDTLRELREQVEQNLSEMKDTAALDALPGRKAPAHAAAKPDASTAYGQLVLAGEKLAALIRRMQGRGAKQQSRLARQINLLVKKFGGR